MVSEYCLVKDGIIENIILATETEATTLGAIDLYPGASIGDKYIKPLSEEDKISRIEQSKVDLEKYLNAHPLLWTDGNYYSITAEKQTQLTSKLAVAQAKSTLGVPYELKWNTTGEVCVPWELSGLFALAFAIDERVTALVAYQQAQEVAIRNAVTKDELDAIIVDYDTVQ